MNELPWRSAGGAAVVSAASDLRPSLAQRIHATLRERIEQGVYPPRSRLPSEAALAREFGVSRPVVREALVRLREEALVRVRKGSGSYVDLPDANVAAVPRLGSLADLDRCFELRLVLESRSAALAAERSTAAAREVIFGALQRLEALTERGEEDALADLAFHLAIAQASGNRYFADMLMAMQENIVFGMKLLRSLTGPRSPRDAQVAIAEHRAISAAIEAADPTVAETAMRLHIERTRRRVFEGDGDIGGPGCASA
jgi:GntR family transcriptional regulator, transcriptional repressor for pyruvate dehydrogenase complex